MSDTKKHKKAHRQEDDGEYSYGNNRKMWARLKRKDRKKDRYKRNMLDNEDQE